VIIFTLLAVVAVSAQIRPIISETFEGEGYAHITTVNGTFWGLGRWVIDEPQGHSLEFWEYTHEHEHFSVHTLKRYDLKAEYFITWERHPTPRRVCHKRSVQPPMPPAWHWVRDSHYIGKHLVDGTTYDVWRHHIGPNELEVAVGENDASRPHYFHQRSPFEHRTYHLISWATFKPNATWFTVPDICKNATELEPVSEEMMGADSRVSQCGAVVASNAARAIKQSNDQDAVSMLSFALNQAEVAAPSNLWDFQANGKRCDGGARVGDIFFDGLPAKSVAVYLGDDQFAECSALLGGKRCSIVPQRDFTGGCRRYC